jgi:Domain of unknown function (DUF4424)
MGHAGFINRSVGAALMLGTAVLPVSANDTTAELSVGGLVFTRSADVSMEAEELKITPELVNVRYRFLNLTPAPVTLTVAFPLPDIDLSDAENYNFPADDPVNFVGFETKVDGKPITFNIHQQAFLSDQDVTAKLRDIGVPLLPIGAQQSKLSELPPAARARLIEQGLLQQSGTNEKGQPLYDAAWTVKTSVVRQQTFPPNRPVMVEHRYRTSLGVSFDTVLRNGLRSNKAMEREVERYRTRYCVQDDFLAAIDKLGAASEANTEKLQERRISYVLKTGANWAGPIKDFTLVVDKGKPDRLVSFCGDNIVKISPTAFQIRAKDFAPNRDLAILIVGRFR